MLQKIRPSGHTRSVSGTENATPHHERFIWVDWARAVACSSVVLLHVWDGVIRTSSTDAVGAVKVIGFTRLCWWVGIQTVLTRWAVPCFLMITGFLLLTNPANRNWKRVMHYATRMVYVILTFGYAFCLIEEWFSCRTIDVAIFFTSAYNLLCGNSWSHMWYVYVLLGFYLMLPLMATFVQSVDKGTFRFTLATLAITTMLIPTINNLAGTSFTTIVPITGFSVFYLLLGGYVRAHGLNITQRMKSIGAGLIAVDIALEILWMAATGTGPTALESPDNPLIAIYSIVLIATFKEVMNVKNPPALVSALSKYSFGIYIVHPIVLNALYKGLGISPLTAPLGSSFLFFLFALSVSFCITACLQRTRLFGRIL